MSKILRTKDSPIAIVGMASIFANARTLDEYWDNIMEKVDAIIDVPADRWRIEDYYDADPFAPDKTYCKRGGFIPEIDFNPMEFGLPPNILEVTDVAQLLSLVVAKEVLQDAGVLNNPNVDRDRIGVTLGVGGGQKLIGPLVARLQYPIIDRVLESSGIAKDDRDIIIEKYKKAFVRWEENSFPGMLGNVISGRITNRFDLGGMNCVVDAACASSLAAMKMSVKELQDGSSDMMITGGVCCDNSIFMYMSFSKTPAFSPTGIIQPFDEDSQGMLVGEGVGMLALKRLEDAERDGDRIYAVLKGIGSSSDGKYKSIYAPRSSGQARALRRAYEDAGVDPKTVGLIEAHGTGTAAGDLAEFGGLTEVFGDDNTRKNHIALGSVKSQIGHTKAAAGTAGLMKAVLALHHKVLPPTINVTKPNKALNIESSPFYVNSETRPWIQDGDTPRRAGVSAFGFGGTNFHFVLEEYKPQVEGHYRIQTVPVTVLITASDKHSLSALCQQMIAQLQVENAAVAYQQFIWTNAIRTIPAQQPRLAFTSKNTEEAVQFLQQAVERLAEEATEWLLPSGLHFRQSAAENARVVGLFSGQGSQYVNMGKELACNFPPMLSLVSAMNKLFKQERQEPALAQVLYPNPVFSKEAQKQLEQNLQLTQYAQPAIGLLSLGLYKIFTQAALRIEAVAGHSFGELTAYCAAGVVTESDYLRLAKARGRAMAAPADPNFDAGTMIAVVGDSAAVEALVANINGAQVANYNSGSQVVVAGASQAVQQAKEQLKAAGFRVIDLPVSAAFHTPLVAHAQLPFSQMIDSVEFRPAQMPIYSNATGQLHSTDAQQLKDQLKAHILNSVRFKEEIEAMYAAGARVFVEFGPKNILSRLVGDILKGKPHHCVATNPSPAKDSDWQVRNAAAQLAVLGVLEQPIDRYEVAREDLSQKKSARLNVKLSAASYVSDKTRTAYEEALADGHIVSHIARQPSSVSEPAELVNSAAVQHVNQTAATVATPELTLAQPEPMQVQAAPVAAAVAPTPAPAPVPMPTPVVAPQPIIEPVEAVAVTPTPTPVAAPAPVPTPIVAPQPVVEPAAAVATNAPVNLSLSADKVTELTPMMLSVVAEKTGYPSDMLELSMDMEADLGIDSIKRVEILGAMQDQVGELPDLDPDELSELRTLQQVVDYLRAKLSGEAITPSAAAPVAEPAPMQVQAAPVESVAAAVAPTPTPVAAPAPVPTPVVAPQPVVEPAAAVATNAPVNLSLSADKITELTPMMLSVVAEKTGYPSDMLELSMDMEADLGIDSIKRVEILGAMQDQVGELPDLDPDELSELRTLQQVVDYLRAKLSGEAITPSAAAPVAEPAPMQVQAAPVEAVAVTPTPTPVAAPAPVPTPIVAPQPVVEPAAAVATNAPVNLSLSADKITELTPMMLSVVAEKTGYPSDMLELSMDMEADLGIDSIKRVEILGAMQDQVGELPDLDPDELSELRTLQQVVDYLRAKLSGEAITPSAAAPVAEPAPMQVQAAPVESVAAAVAPTPTPVAAPAPVPTPVVAPQPVVEPAAAVATNAPVNLNLSADKVTELTPMMLSVVAEKTGYPSDMLELSMDMEADLGIDSIKRVEILGAMQDQVGELPDLDPDELSELRTLQQVVDYLRAKLSGEAIAPSAAAPVAEPVPALAESVAPVAPIAAPELTLAQPEPMQVQAAPVEAAAAAVAPTPAPAPELTLTDLELEEPVVEVDGVDKPSLTATVEQPIAPLDLSGSSSSAVADAGRLQLKTVEQLQHLTPLMLDVVAEKTGYPSDMLELSMDMEADLGIDSIKRVEILGAMQDQVGELPDLDPDELSELRTLQQVVDYLKSKVSEGGLPEAQVNVDVRNTFESESIDMPEASFMQLSEELTTLAPEPIEKPVVQNAVVDDTAGDVIRVSHEAPRLESESIDMPEASFMQLPEESMMVRDNSIDQKITAEDPAPSPKLELEPEYIDMPEASLIQVPETSAMGITKEVPASAPKLSLEEPLSAVSADTQARAAIKDNSLDLDLGLSPLAAASMSVVETQEVFVGEKSPSSSVIIKKLPVVSMLDDIGLDGQFLVVDDGSDFALQCCEQLLAKNLTVSVLQWPEQFISSNNNFSHNKVYQLANWDEASIQAKVQEIIAAQNLKGVLILQPRVLAHLNKQIKEAFVQACFMLSKHVHASIKRTAETSKRSAFITVSRLDGCLGYGDAVIGDVTPAALFGLAKSAKQEWPEIFCRTLDIAPGISANNAAAYLVSELFDADTSLPEVAYGPKGRICLEIQSRNSYKLPAGGVLDSSSVLLVSGGAKGVTKSCALRLAKQYQCKFILLGRSAIAQEPDWASAAQSEADLKRSAMEAMKANGEKPVPKVINTMVNAVQSTREIQNTLKEMQRAGAQTEYLSVDVTDANAMKEALAPVVMKFGAINGIVHGAGVLADKLIVQKSAADIARVYRTKVDGLDAMLSCVDVAQLKVLALFSSAAGFYGNIGQSDYSAANEILNKRALDFKRANPKTHVVTFNWGPWDGGMVSPTLKKMFAERGVYVIPVDAGAQLFVNELTSANNDAVQVLVGTAMIGSEYTGATPVKKI